MRRRRLTTPGEPSTNAEVDFNKPSVKSASSRTGEASNSNVAAPARVRVRVRPPRLAQAQIRSRQGPELVTNGCDQLSDYGVDDPYLPAHAHGPSPRFGP